MRRHVGTFSGCGGSSLGVKLTGRFATSHAVEFDPNAVNVYRLNHPATEIIDRSIVAVTAADFGPATIDLLEGSPPCSKFSMAGRREASWGKLSSSDSSKQIVANVEDLFFEYCRLVDELRPKAFIAENVPGLARGVARGYLSDIVRRLDSSGYNVTVNLVDASRHGVPQRRHRLILVGLHKDYGLTPTPIPETATTTTIGDACPWIETMIAKSAFANLKTRNLTLIRWTPDQPCATILSNGYAGVSPVEVGVIRTPGGHPPIVDPQDGALEQAIKAAGGRALKRRTGQTMHRLTVTELKRLSSFPDDYQFTGPYQQRWARIGNAVPPLLMRSAANHVADLLDQVDT